MKLVCTRKTRETAHRAVKNWRWDWAGHSPRSVICSAHFRAECFQELATSSAALNLTAEHGISYRERYSLKPDAIPTTFSASNVRRTPKTNDSLHQERTGRPNNHCHQLVMYHGHCHSQDQMPSVGNTSSAVAQTSVRQTSSAVEQTLPPLGQTASSVAQTSLGQTSSAMGQTLPSLGQTSSWTGQAARSLTSSNRATWHLCACERAFTDSNTDMRWSSQRWSSWEDRGHYQQPIQGVSVVEGALAKRLPCKKTGTSTKCKSVAPKRRNFCLDAKTAVFIATSCLKRRQMTIVFSAPSVSDGHTTSVQE